MSNEGASRIERRAGEYLDTIDHPPLAPTHPAVQALARFHEVHGERVCVAVVGTPSSGKSELVNALVEHKALLPTGTGRTSVNAVCIRLGPDITEEAAWIEWLSEDDARWLLNELDARPEAAGEAQALRDAWALRASTAVRQREEISVGDVARAATDQLTAWPMVRRIVVELPLSVTWAATPLGAVGLEIIDLPAYGTAWVRDELVDRTELHGVDTVLFLTDQPLTPVTDPLVQRLVGLLKETGTAQPERRVLPVLNKADVCLEAALEPRQDVVDRLSETTGRLDLRTVLVDLELQHLEQLQRGLCGDGPGIPFLTVAVDGFGPSNRVAESARGALRDLSRIARRLPAGEEQHRLVAPLGDGGLAFLRAAVAEHARRHAFAALVRQRVEAAETLAKELERLPESVQELAQHPLAVHMQLRETVSQLDFDGEFVQKLSPLLERWVAADVCGWPFWRTAVNSVENGLVSSSAIAARPGAERDGAGTNGNGRSAASATATANRRSGIPAHLLKKLEERERVVADVERPVGVDRDTALPRTAAELQTWFADAYERSLLRLIGDLEEPSPSTELRQAVAQVWSPANDLFARLADGALSPEWESVLDVDLYAEFLADDLARQHRPDSGAPPRQARLPVNAAVDVLPWARSTASSPHNESYWQPQHLAVIVYERLSLVESLVAQLAAAIRASARYAALMVYNGMDAEDENPYGRLPLRRVMRAVGDLRPASPVEGSSHSVTQLIADLRDLADEEHQSVTA